MHCLFKSLQSSGTEKDVGGEAITMGFNKYHSTRSRWFENVSGWRWGEWGCGGSGGVGRVGIYLGYQRSEEMTAGGTCIQDSIWIGWKLTGAKEGRWHLGCCEKLPSSSQDFLPSELPIGSAEVFVKTTSQPNFLVCLILFSLLLSHSIALDPKSIRNSLYPNLCLTDLPGKLKLFISWYQEWCEKIDAKLRYWAVSYIG